MIETLEKEIKYANNKKAKYNLEQVLIYLKTLQTIIYKIKEGLILNDDELEVYKNIK